MQQFVLHTDVFLFPQIGAIFSFLVAVFLFDGLLPCRQHQKWKWFKRKRTNTQSNHVFLKLLTFFQSLSLMIRLFHDLTSYQQQLNYAVELLQLHWIKLLIVSPLGSSCRYYYLAFRAHQMPETSKENAVAILERAKLEGWVLGKTKVFRLLHITKK